LPVAFADPVGVQWTVVPRLVGRGPEAVPDGFEFTSDHGERRFLRWDPLNFSPRDVDEEKWRALLRASTLVT
jgi:hypothetical protein